MIRRAEGSDSAGHLINVNIGVTLLTQNFRNRS
jgi:hypothetical protein